MFDYKMPGTAAPGIAGACAAVARRASRATLRIAKCGAVGTFLQSSAVRDCSLLFPFCADWAHPAKERAVKRNRTMTATLHGTDNRQQLNDLMEAIALIIARRQMKRRWPPSGQRASLPSII
jgi:hypothetical protein